MNDPVTSADTFSTTVIGAQNNVATFLGWCYASVRDCCHFAKAVSHASYISTSLSFKHFLSHRFCRPQLVIKILVFFCQWNRFSSVCDFTITICCLSYCDGDCFFHHSRLGLLIHLLRLLVIILLLRISIDHSVLLGIILHIVDRIEYHYSYWYILDWRSNYSICVVQLRSWGFLRFWKFSKLLFFWLPFAFEMDITCMFSIVVNPEPFI